MASMSMNQDSIQEILDKSYKYLKAANLRPFLLTLPLHGPAAESNQEGIREKIFKNKSYIITDQNPECSTTKDCPKSVQFMNQVVDRLTSDEIVGFVMVIAEYLGEDEVANNNNNNNNNNNDSDTDNNNSIPSNAAFQYRPVAGGIVELLDEYERAIRGIWCRRSLNVSITESFLKVIIMRIIAHAFEWQHPNKPNKKISSKLVSSLEIHALSFPIETHTFLTTPMGLNLSKHWETEDDGGAHNDSPNQKCKCFKLADKEGAWQFWGISESRFLKLWNAKKDFFIPSEPPLPLVELFSHTKNGASKELKSNKRANQQSRNSEVPSKRKS